MRLREIITEEPLSDYQPLGDFAKPGPFTGVDKKLVPHAATKMKAEKFFEKTPYDFRLFFSNVSGTGKYSESGVTSPASIQKIFGEQAPQIITGSEDAITVVFVGNSGTAKVMMTPWIMAHRFGHAIQATGKNSKGWSVWGQAEEHFFTTVNNTLSEYYGKKKSGVYGTGSNRMNYDQTAEYNALFNAVGTQKSSRSNQIKRPYEFMYELFAQYLKDGKITLNPLPTNLTYGRKVFGNPTQYMKIKTEYTDESDRSQASGILANDMGYMFNDVLSSSVGNIYVM
jgi:hypothetical protein